MQMLGMMTMMGMNDELRTLNGCWSCWFAPALFTNPAAVDVFAFRSCCHVVLAAEVTILVLAVVVRHSKHWVIDPAICELCSANASKTDAIFAIHQEHPNPPAIFQLYAFTLYLPLCGSTAGIRKSRSLQSNTRFGSGAKLAWRIFCTSTWHAGLPQ